MADLAEAIAAAAAQAAAPADDVIPSVDGSAAQTPTSPLVKPEPSHDDDVTMRDENTPPHPPVKRSRSPQDDPAAAAAFEGRHEKRPKIEEDDLIPDEDMDEFARLIQEAEASIMQDIPMEIHDDHFDLTACDDTHDTLAATSNAVPEDYSSLFHEDASSYLDMDSQAAPILDFLQGMNFDIQPPKPPEPESIWSHPTSYTRRKHILPTLGSLAIDTLITWCEQSLEDTIGTLRNDPDSEVTREYTELRTAFEAQRSLLSTAHPLLDGAQLGIYGAGREIIRIANLATACTSLFSTNEVEWEELNEHFLRIFVPEGEGLAQDTADILLGLKTQMFMAMLESEQGKSRDRILEELFSGLRESLQAHHINLPLTPVELQFLSNADARRAMLLNESGDDTSVDALGAQFSYVGFLDSLNAYLNDRIEDIKTSGTAPADMNISNTAEDSEQTIVEDHDDPFDLNAAIARATTTAMESTNETADDMDSSHSALLESIRKAAEQASQAAPNASSTTAPNGEKPNTVDVGTTSERPNQVASNTSHSATPQNAQSQSIGHASTPQQQATATPVQQQQHQQLQNHYSHQKHPHPTQNQTQSQFQKPPQPQSQQQAQTQPQGTNPRPPQQYYSYQQQQAANSQPTGQNTGNRLPPNQSDSTPALYERARQAAAARSSTQARREGTHSTRRPWTPEEEKALMMGLDLVKGPHWSQILGLFGPSGTVSTILADRTQVQLKDKARNLKLFFLKANTEMPYYLQCVTGELKTRAPTQAARKEAEEKAKSEEQQAHVNGIMTLPGGLQHGSAPKINPVGLQPRTSTTGQSSTHAASRPMTPSTPHRLAHPPASAPAPRPTMLAAQPVHLPSKITAAAQQQKQQAQQQKSLSQSPRPASQPATQPAVQQQQPQQRSATTYQAPTAVQAHSQPPVSAQAVQAVQAAQAASTAVPQNQPQPAPGQTADATGQEVNNQNEANEEAAALSDLQSTIERSIRSQTAEQHSTTNESVGVNPSQEPNSQTETKQDHEMHPTVPTEADIKDVDGHNDATNGTNGDAEFDPLADLRAAIEREAANARNETNIQAETQRPANENNENNGNTEQLSQEAASMVHEFLDNNGNGGDEDDTLRELKAALHQETSQAMNLDEFFSNMSGDDDPLKDLKAALERETSLHIPTGGEQNSSSSLSTS